MNYVPYVGLGIFFSSHSLISVQCIQIKIVAYKVVYVSFPSGGNFEQEERAGIFCEGHPKSRFLPSGIDGSGFISCTHYPQATEIAPRMAWQKGGDVFFHV